MTASPLPPSVEWRDDGVHIVDQRRIPAELVVRRLSTVDDVIDAIETLAVRGANVIGSTGALGLVLGLRTGAPPQVVARKIIAARPTAVNLRVAVEAVLSAHERGEDALEAALALIAADRDQCHLIGEHGRHELSGASRLLTHCNTGRLATTGWGTALGIAYAKQAAGEPVQVTATETRPLRQGARLTAWELGLAGIPVDLIIDSAAASVLASGRIDAVVVGADRIAANGDTANKIGTRMLAILARHAGVPFYVAATLNAFDPSVADGSVIPIEDRSPDEITEPLSGVSIRNPAFDVTEADLITGFITEAGVLRAPFGAAIREVVIP